MIPDGSNMCEVCDAWLSDGEMHTVAGLHAVGLVSPRPRARGAAIVVPRRHVVSPSELSIPELTDLWRIVHIMTKAIETFCDPDGMHTWHDIGSEAQSSFAHLTVDIVPRHHRIEYHFRPWQELSTIAAEDRIELVRNLRSAIEDQADLQS